MLEIYIPSMYSGKIEQSLFFHLRFRSTTLCLSVLGKKRFSDGRSIWKLELGIAEVDTRFKTQSVRTSSTVGDSG